MDYELIKTGVLVANMAANFVIGFFVMVDRRERVGQEAIEKLEIDMEKRIGDLQKSIHARNNKHDSEIVGLHKRMDAILKSSSESNEKMGRVLGSIGGIENQVTLLNEHLLNRSRRTD